MPVTKREKNVEEMGRGGGGVRGRRGRMGRMGRRGKCRGGGGVRETNRKHVSNNHKTISAAFAAKQSCKKARLFKTQFRKAASILP